MDEDERVERPGERTAATTPRRRPYAAPTLVEYGSVAKLTQSGGNTIVEHGTPKKGLS